MIMVHQSKSKNILWKMHVKVIELLNLLHLSFLRKCKGTNVPYTFPNVHNVPKGINNELALILISHLSDKCPNWSN